MVTEGTDLVHDHHVKRPGNFLLFQIVTEPLVFSRKSDKAKPTIVPTGMKFTPYPIYDKDAMYRLNLDPRCVMMHKFSATTTLAFFLLEPEAPSRSTLQSFKTEAQKNEKFNARHVTFSDMETEDENEETVPFDPPAPHNTEEEAIENATRDEIRGKFRRLDAMNRKWNTAHPTAAHRITKHELIYVKCFVCRDTITETSADLKMPKTTVSESVKHINKIARPYYED